MLNAICSTYVIHSRNSGLLLGSRSRSPCERREPEVAKVEKKVRWPDIGLTSYEKLIIVLEWPQAGTPGTQAYLQFPAAPAILTQNVRIARTALSATKIRETLVHFTGISDKL